jgi:hypothetical protein
MRKITQLVALMVALLVAGQSALAESSCNQWLLSGGGRAPACCISTGDAAAPQVSADCHGSIHVESVMAECNHSGCQMATVRVGAQALATARFKADRVTTLAVIAQLPVTSASVLTTRSVRSASAPGPASYMLFQVFRI